MTKARKVHWAYLKTSIPSPMCGEPNRGATLTHDQAAVTCGRCRNLLGIKPFTKEQQVGHAVREAAKAQGVDMWTHNSGADRLISRAFSDLDATFDDLVSRARAAVADYERYPTDPPAEVMAEILRGFITALGRTD